MRYPEYTLEQFIYGKAINSSGEPGKLDILAVSGGLNQDDLSLLRSMAVVEPLPIPDIAASESVGIFIGPGDDFILTRAHLQDGNVKRPIYQYILLPRPVVTEAAGGVQTLIDALRQPIPVFDSTRQSIDLIQFSPPPAADTTYRIAALRRLIDQHAGGDFNLVLALLGAALTERQLVMRGFPMELRARLEVVEGLAMLLPAPGRAAMTFSTCIVDPPTARGRVVFRDNPQPTQRWLADFAERTFPELDAVRSPYIDCLSESWNGDIPALLDALHPVEVVAARLMPGKPLAEGLAAAVTRCALDQQVMIPGATIDPELLKAVLSEEPLPDEPLRAQYITRLMEYALVERDAEAAEIVAAFMDADPALDEILNAMLTDTLETEPDGVYFFIRTRLASGTQTSGPEEPWLSRLQAAAVVSLQVAINDGESETLIEWLRLIAREPASYQLGAILDQGLLAAQERTHEDGDLGLRLLLFASKRAAASIDMLLDDPLLVGVLAEPLGSALREHDAQAVVDSLALGKEIGLIILARAMTKAPQNPQAAAIFTPDVIQHLWALFVDPQAVTLPQHYQPAHLVEGLVAGGVRWLEVESLDMLLTLIIRDERQPQFLQILRTLQERDKLFDPLAAALYNSELPPHDVLNLVRQAVTDGIISQQQSIDIYLSLITAHNWDNDMLPLVEQIARVGQQSPDIVIPQDVLWLMLDIAAQTKMEMVARAALRRVVVDLDTPGHDAELVEALTRLLELVNWNATLRQSALNWWRAFVQAQSIARLTALDKLMDKRILEDARGAVQSAIAIRKMLGNRTLEEFADAIGVAYDLLQALSDSFDPTGRHAFTFDQTIVRAEIEAREDVLSPQERSIMAKNLKELAQLIITMADNRSKASLIRREDNIDRQLQTGEQEPQSAIDIMKWLSGYLSGMQSNGE